MPSSGISRGRDDDDDVTASSRASPGRALLEVGERLAPRGVERDAQQLQLGVGQLRRQQALQRRNRQDLHLQPMCSVSKSREPWVDVNSSRI